MARPIPDDRPRRLIEAATEVFIREGYQRTQMDDVAGALGTAKGTVYRYVESKAALFHLVLRCADGHEAPPGTSEFPLCTPSPGATVDVVRGRLAREVLDMELLLALGRPDHPDAAVELASIIRDLYARMSRNRHGIKLVDRSARDQPELARVWFGQGRWAQHAALVTYLERRIAQGSFRPVPSVEVSARTILESIAFWAVHRHWDPSPQPVTERAVEATLVDLALYGFSKESK